MKGFIVVFFMLLTINLNYNLVVAQNIKGLVEQERLINYPYIVNGYLYKDISFLSSFDIENIKIAEGSDSPVIVITTKLVTVTGTVIDEFGDPIIGADIRVKDTTNGTVTDIDGKFSIRARCGNILEVFFIGYKSKQVTIKRNMIVVLLEDCQSLEEVLIIY